MTCEIVTKTFILDGIRKECLFKDFPTAISSAKAEFADRTQGLSSDADTELIFYRTTEEELHPDRHEICYYGRLVNGDSELAEGLERIRITEQKFVSTVYRGIIEDIWKGYQAINEYLKEHSLQKDSSSAVVELYDNRFNPESADSEMEIYIPIKA
jgi:predicted transcriptional regulator YdeE